MRNNKIIINDKERSVRFNAQKMCFECNVGYKDNNFKQQSRIIRGKSLIELTENVTNFEDKLNKELITAENTTFEAFAEYYFSNIAAIKNNSSSVCTKRYYYNKIPEEIKKAPLKELTSQQLQSFYVTAYQKYSDNSVHNFHELIGTILNQAVSYKYIKENPNKKCVIRPCKVGKKVYWSVDTCKRFLTFLKENDEYRDLHNPVYFAMITGVRKGEILGIKYKDLDFKHGIVRITGQIKIDKGRSVYSEILKTKKSKRSFKIPVKIFSQIFEQKYFEREQFVFLHKGKPWATQTFSRRVKDAFNAFGAPDMTIKQLRSSFTKTSIENNVPLKAIQVMLGHSKLSTTADIYGDIVSEDTFQYADNMLAAWS